jgi:polyprenyl-phospho-N-acetylgalactosaminyl synthase
MAVMEGQQPAAGVGSTAVVVPVYNEATVITEVVADLRRHFALVLCVDDGSDDDGAARARAAGAVVIQHPINLGQGAALQTGIDFALRHTDARYLVTFDADGQHRVDDAVAMVGTLAAGDSDVVLGSRFLADTGHIAWTRRTVLRLAVLYTNWRIGRTLTDAHNGLRAMTREAASVVKLRQHGMTHASEIIDQLAATSLRIVEQPVYIDYTDYSRSKGQSSWNSVNILFDLILR